MNCVRCNTPLEANARFCRNCGLPAAVTFEQAQQRASYIPTQQDDAATAQAAWMPSPQSPPPPAHQAPNAPSEAYNQSNSPGTFQPAPTQPAKPKRRSSVGGCLLAAFGLLAVLIIGLGAAWAFVVRPYLHNLAIQNLDATMTQMVDQIPSQTSQLPPGPVPPVPIQQNIVNSLIALHTSPSDLVQHPDMQITPNNVQFTFQISGQACTITGVPEAQAGNLVITNVTVSGIIGLILSPDDITTLVNKHLADAQARLNHQVASVQLADQLMILLLV